MLLHMGNTTNSQYLQHLFLAQGRGWVELWKQGIWPKPAQKTAGSIS